MRIALCFSGQPRSVETGWESLKVIFEKNEIDVFVHTWWDDKYLDEGLEASYSGNENNIHKNTLKVIEDLYNPVSMIVDPPKEKFDVDLNLRKERIQNYGEDHVAYNFTSQFWSMKQSNDLKKEFENKMGFLYDVVIRARFDLYIDTFINFQEQAIDKNTIYIPSRWDYLYSSELGDDYRMYYGGKDWEQYLRYSNYGVPDVFYFGSSKCSDVWSSLYDNVDMMLKDNLKMPFIPEVLFRQLLEDREININTMVNIDVDLLRNGKRQHGD